MASFEVARRTIEDGWDCVDTPRKTLEKLDVKRVMRETKALERELEGEICIDTKQYDEKLQNDELARFDTILSYCEKRVDELEEKHK